MPDHHIPDSFPEFPLDRYLTGEATAAERARIEAWLAGDPLRARLLTELRQAGEGPLPPIDTQALGARIERHLDALDIDRTSPTRRTSFPRHGGTFTSIRGWASVAAGVVVLVAVGYGYTRRATLPSADRPVEATQTYSTRAGQRATITLADGSQVTLAPQTTLTLAPGFGSQSRQVTVDGEAYFVVAHTSGSPFTVNAGNAIARVLGTTFDVRKFQHDTAVRVIVADGKVAVRSTQSTTRSDAQGILTASTMAVVSDSGAVTLTPNVSVDDYVAWTDGRLVFRDTPLRDAIDELTRAYGTTVVADSTLLERHVTLSATTTRQSLTEVLDVLVKILDAHYTKNGDVMTIRPGQRSVREMRKSAPTFMVKQYGR